MIKRIERPFYLQRLIAFRDKKLIKVVTGVRRCGKSTLLEIYQDYLRSSGTEESQIVSVNLEDYDCVDLRQPSRLHEWLKERLLNDRMTYIFIDEIQHCESFQDVINSIALRQNVDIYITGSNAYMLSGELATLLSGRYVEIHMFPLSFKEFVGAVGGEDNLPARYREYIETGSFPYLPEFINKPREIHDYLDSLYHTIIVKDISNRKKVSDLMVLERVTRFLFESIGSPVSLKKISDTLTSSGRKSDPRTIEKYLFGLVESCILYEAKRYDIRGKEYLRTQEKYYAVDIGLRRLLLGTRLSDVGHILENIVFLELKRRFTEVYVGKVNSLEVDFVVFDEHGKQYIQVAASVRDENTLRRELAPLMQIKDQYPKMILTLDDDPDMDFDGIRCKSALRWLLDS